jgi:hypothetical protein
MRQVRIQKKYEVRYRYIRDEVLPLDPRDPDILRAKRTQRDRRALDDPESRGESAGPV